jgi:hypothetical protein
MNKNFVKLLNTVKIVQKSGSKINTKNCHHDIAEILLKVALSTKNHSKSIK